MFLIANARDDRTGVVHLLLLLVDLFIHGRDRTIHDFLFFFDALVLINGDDLIGDVGRFLRISVKHTDLQQIGIAHFIHGELSAQYLIGLLSRWPIAVFAPSILEL